MDYKMHIKEEFINLIKNGIKKNEYRLNKDNRSSIKKGDILNLISNDELDSIKCKVINVTNYKTLSEAIDLSDFKGLYKTYDEVLNACKEFYSDEDVLKYGILKFEIKYEGD